MRSCSKQLQGERDLVRVVDISSRSHQLRVALESTGELRARLSQVSELCPGLVVARFASEFAQLPGMSRERNGRDVLVLGARENVDQRAQEPRRITERAVARQAKVKDVLAQEKDRFGSIEQ